MKNKLMKSLFVLGMGFGIATTATAARFDQCNDLQFACEVQNNESACIRYWNECLA